MKECPICKKEYDDSDDFCDEHDIRLVSVQEKLKLSIPTSLTLQHQTKSFLGGFTLVIKESCILGRENTDELAKAEYEDISRKHCEIIFKEGGIYIQDSKSSNGTWINDKKLEEDKQTQILIGDVLTLSTHSFKVIRIEQ